MMNDGDFNHDENPQPHGELALQTVAMPTDTNPRGDIFAGWLMSQMDLAAAIAATKLTRDRIATVAVGPMHFMSPVHVGAVVSCYTDIVETGNSSMLINVEVWITHKVSFERVKVTETQFTFVAIDAHGKTRPIAN